MLTPTSRGSRDRKRLAGVAVVAATITATVRRGRVRSGNRLTREHRAGEDRGPAATHGARLDTREAARTASDSRDALVAVALAAARSSFPPDAGARPRKQLALASDDAREHRRRARRRLLPPGESGRPPVRAGCCAHRLSRSSGTRPARRSLPGEGVARQSVRMPASRYRVACRCGQQALRGCLPRVQRGEGAGPLTGAVVVSHRRRTVRPSVWGGRRRARRGPAEVGPRVPVEAGLQVTGRAR
jgi:hypothetical protein